MTDITTITTISPIEFGRVLGHLEGIRSELVDLKSRTVSRMDNLESRVGHLENYRAKDETPTLADSLVDKLVWGVLGAVGFLILKLVFPEFL